jgi:hypothetical protein
MPAALTSAKYSHGATQCMTQVYKPTAMAWIQMINFSICPQRWIQGLEALIATIFHVTVKETERLHDAKHSHRPSNGNC